MKDDQTIQTIRQIRSKISARCGHDAASLLQYYRKIQQKYTARIPCTTSR